MNNTGKVKTKVHRWRKVPGLPGIKSLHGGLEAYHELLRGRLPVLEEDDRVSALSSLASAGTRSMRRKIAARYGIKSRSREPIDRWFRQGVPKLSHGEQQKIFDDLAGVHVVDGWEKTPGSVIASQPALKAYRKHVSSLGLDYKDFERPAKFKEKKK